MKKIILKVLKITGITLGSIIALMFLLPMLFPNFVAKKIKSWANGAITGELNFSKARLSFFNHFPALTLTLYDFSLKGSAPFQKDTLLATNELALGIRLNSLLSEKIDIDEIYVSRGMAHVEVDSAGNANYNVYQSTPSEKTPSTDTSGASLKIEKIQIDHLNLLYDDRSIPMVITAKDLNYLGKGDLTKSIFDLSSKINVDSFSFAEGGQEYIHTKNLHADLITKINTNSLSFIFEKNDLKLNTLPVNFKGRVDFLKEGYYMDFRLISNATDLRDVFSALPPEYTDWVEKRNAHGKTDMTAALTGIYDANTNTMPSLSFDMKVRDGSIAYNKAPEPVQNLFLNFHAAFPHFNPDSLYVNVDSLYFTLGQGYFSSVVRVQGLNVSHLHARVNTKLDLEKLDKAMGLEAYDLKGMYTADLTVEGKYRTGVVYSMKGFRQQADTVITCIPSFTLKSTMQNGYFKYASLPQGISNISFNLDASCPDSVYQHAVLNLDNLNANAMGNFVKGFFHVKNMKDYSVDGNIQSIIDLGEIHKFYPLDSMELAGHLNVDAKVKGRYVAKKEFPVTTIQLDLKDGRLKTKYYPNPIEQIQVGATITNTTGSMKSMTVKATPISFLFEGLPFTIQADLQNFNDLRYNIKSAGTLDVGKIYKVFSQQGMDVKGFIKMSLALQGLQSDATKGHYDRLHNSGTLTLKDITVSLTEFPKPLVIEKGVFRFQQDKMWFEEFDAVYGNSHFKLNGYLSNVLNYVMNDKASLKGQFDLKSDLVVVDEFTAFSSEQTTAPKAASTAAPDNTGVVVVPSNLSLIFNADVKKVLYNGMTITNMKGHMRIDSSKIFLTETGFTLVGAPFLMDATYGSITPKKAFFKYKIDAKDFDVKRAYNEIKVFKELAPAAGKAEGIISLNYELEGKLDQNMMPVYPTLKGKGVLSLKKVKVNGLKLFGAVSKATGRDSVNNPDLSEVKIKSSIKDNIMTIERTKMKIFGFRPRIEGQVSLDGKLNLKFRLGLPPFGIIGIPMTITGTGENPKVHMGKGHDTDSLEATHIGPDLDEN